MINATHNDATALKVLEIVAQVVGSTYGPRGSLVAINDENGVHVTKDGVSVLNSMFADTQYEQAFLDIIKEASMNTMSRAGDGTTATIVLSDAFCKNNPGMKGKDEFLAEAEKFLKDLSITNLSDEMMMKLILTSCNWDEKLAEVIFNAGKKGGPVVAVPNIGGDTELVTTESIEIMAGIVAPEFIDDMSESETKMDNPVIVISTSRLEGESDIVDLIDTLIALEEENLVLLVPETEMQSVAILKINHLHGTMKILPVLIGPISNTDRDGALYDLSVATGATLLGSGSGISMSTIKKEHFGRAENVTYSKGKLIISGAKGCVEHRKSVAKSYTDSIPNEPTEHGKEILRMRASVVTGIGVKVMVGGENLSAVLERKDRADDAIQAMLSAKKSGVLPGGGMAYEYLSKQPFAENFKDALSIPLTILSGDRSVSPTFEIYKDTVSYSVKHGIVPITHKDAPIDSLETVQSVITQSLELASLLLRIKATVTKNKNKE